MKKLLMLFCLTMIMFIPSTTTFAETNQMELAKRSKDYVVEFNKGIFTTVQKENPKFNNLKQQYSQLIEKAGSFERIFRFQVNEKDDLDIVGIVSKHKTNYIMTMFAYTKDGKLNNISGGIIDLSNFEKTITLAQQHSQLFRNNKLNDFYKTFSPKLKEKVSLENLQVYYNEINKHTSNKIIDEKAVLTFVTAEFTTIDIFTKYNTENLRLSLTYNKNNELEGFGFSAPSPDLIYLYF